MNTINRRLSFMEKLIIFYDDTRPSCCRYMSRREVAKHLRKEFRQYRKYQKDRNRDQKEKQGE